MYTLANKKVFVAGHRGMVGGAIVNRLQEEKCGSILTANRDVLDLTQQASVNEWMKRERPDAVFIAAAKVGGILANDSYPAEFLYQNLMIEANIIHAAHAVGVEKLLFLGSSCIYPKFAPQPIPEDALLTGPLEETNEWYAIAKIAGIKLCQAYRRQYGADFISAMPTNLYGPGDNYDLQTSHVIPALIRKAVEAKNAGEKSLEVWGDGSPLREFMDARDCADALVFIMKNYSDADHINIGSGMEIQIGELAQKISTFVGLEDPIRFDTSKPIGTPRKLMSNERLTSMGWSPKISLETGLKEAIASYLENHAP